MKTEPSVLAGTATAVVTAALALLVSFGLGLTDDQQKAILGFVAVVAPIIGAFIVRSRVTPNAKVVETVNPDGTRVAGEASPLPTGTEIQPGTTNGMGDTGPELRGGF